MSEKLEEKNQEIAKEKNQEIAKEKKQENSMKEMLKTIVIAIVLAALIRHFIFNTTLVKGVSMEPTLHQNDRLICYIAPLYFRDPKQGDIVIIDAPDGSGREYVKRVIGIPGDEIEIKDGQVYVNGVEKKEAYIHPQVETEVYNLDHWKLKNDEFFVLGDNRNPGKSEDSRFFGPVEKRHINSIASFRYYPFNKIGKM